MYFCALCTIGQPTHLLIPEPPHSFSGTPTSRTLRNFLNPLTVYRRSTRFCGTSPAKPGTPNQRRLCCVSALTTKGGCVVYQHLRKQTHTNSSPYTHLFVTYSWCCRPCCCGSLPSHHISSLSWHPLHKARLDIHGALIRREPTYQSKQPTKCSSKKKIIN